MKKRILALLMCAALIFSLFGCTQEPAPTETTAPPETEPPGMTAYNEARSAVDAAAELTLRITESTTTTIFGEVFTTRSSQVLQYAGRGTDSPMVFSEQVISFGSLYNVSLDEVWADGTLYVTLDDAGHFTGAFSPEARDARFLPPILLNAALYQDITLETLESHSTVSFAAPTSAESWAMPVGAELIDASGSALLSTAGALQKLNYTISYIDGDTTVEKEYEVYPVIEPVNISVPTNAADFIRLEDPTLPIMAETAIGRLMESRICTVTNTESVLCEAGGVIRNQSATANVYDGSEDLKTKINTSIFLMDYSTNQSQELEQEELYTDGVYTISNDGAEPQTQSGITDNMVLDYTDSLKQAYIIPSSGWQDVTANQLDSGVYYLEYTLSEEFALAAEDSIASVFFYDPAFLDDLASAYKTNECHGYLAIDSVTGLPTASGFYYEGVHTIEGQDYKISIQADQGIEAPSAGAYYAITEEQLPEAEPETKATPLFYHVTGEDGQEMWLFGTIHVGDAHTAYLPQEIYDAFSASDALALEYDSKAFDEQMEVDDALQNQVSDAYFYSDGTDVSQHIDQTLYDQALPYLKASGNYNMNSKYLKVSLWSQMLDNFLLRQTHTLHRDQGVETRLEKLAEEQDKPIRSIESGLSQILMFTGYSDALQELLLKENMEVTLEEYAADIMDLYEKWCAGDEAALREALQDDLSDLTDEELPLYEEYNKAMLIDRNAAMLDVAIDYLESGETVFYAVGLAHLLAGNGLVDTLRDAGYTVELVAFE